MFLQERSAELRAFLITCNSHVLCEGGDGRTQLFVSFSINDSLRRLAAIWVSKSNFINSPRRRPLPSERVAVVCVVFQCISELVPCLLWRNRFFFLGESHCLSLIFS